MFTIPERSFEPTVIFFGLTNSLVIFQTMMNKILQDLINTGKVVSFIVIYQVHSSGKHIPTVHSLSTAKAHLLWRPPYL